MPFLKHSLGKTFYLKKGSNKKELLICLHGGPGGDHRLMLPLLKLSDRYTVIVYDQLGSGKNPETSKAKWNIKTFVQELDLIVKKSGFSKVTLVGSSWGTTLALEYYLKYPKKVKRIVFQSPMFSAADWQADAKRLISKMSSKDKKILLGSLKGKPVDESLFQKSMFNYYLLHVLRNKKKLNELFKWGLSEGGLKIYQHMWGDSEFHAKGTLKNYNQVKKLKTLKVPVLFVCGEFDEATPLTVKKYSKLVVNSTFKEISGGAHVLTYEKPKELLRAIKDFVEFT